MVQSYLAISRTRIVLMVMLDGCHKADAKGVQCQTIDGEGKAASWSLADG